MATDDQWAQVPEIGSFIQQKKDRPRRAALEFVGTHITQKRAGVGNPCARPETLAG